MTRRDDASCLSEFGGPNLHECGGLIHSLSSLCQDAGYKNDLRIIGNELSYMVDGHLPRAC